MKQKLFSLLALFLFVSIGLTTDTKADSMGNPKKQCWMDLTSTKTPCAQYGQIGCAPCDDLLPPGPFPPTYPPNPGS